MVERLISARRQVDALRSTLVSEEPDELERGLPALADAVSCLRSVEQELRKSPDRGGGDRAAIGREANRLRESLAIAGRVIDRGAAFYEGWLRVLGIAAVGYTRAGDPAQLEPEARFSMQG